MKRRTKNLTLAISEETYYKARLYAVQRRMSLSAAVGFLLENLPAVSRAVHQLHEENPDFGSRRTPAPVPKTDSGL